jgi:hypothetical protein
MGMRIVWRTLLALSLLSLSGCTTLQSTDTFAICKATDVMTTGYALRTGHFVEKNPLVAPLVAHGILPLAIVSFGLWWLLTKADIPNAVVAANTITCPVAAHNAWLLLK